LQLLAHLFVTLPQPGDSEVTFYRLRVNLSPVTILLSGHKEKDIYTRLGWFTCSKESGLFGGLAFFQPIRAILKAFKKSD